MNEISHRITRIILTITRLLLMVFIEYDRILEFAENDNDADKLTWMFSRGRKDNQRIYNGHDLIVN